MLSGQFSLYTNKIKLLELVNKLCVRCHSDSKQFFSVGLIGIAHPSSKMYNHDHSNYKILGSMVIESSGVNILGHLPCNRTTIGIFISNSAAASMIPLAMTSQRIIPPKIFTSIAFTWKSPKHKLGSETFS